MSAVSRSSNYIERNIKNVSGLSEFDALEVVEFSYWLKNKIGHSEEEYDFDARRTGLKPLSIQQSKNSWQYEIGYCAECGNKLKSTQNFCSNCGQKLQW